MEQLTQEQYYSYRKLVRNLYDNDIANIGDLCSEVLQVRDKNKCVSSIKVAIKDNAIDIEFDDETPDDKKIKIKDKVANSIGRYIVNNKDSLGDEANTDSFDDFLNADNHLFCDIMMVGNSVKFNL